MDYWKSKAISQETELLNKEYELIHQKNSLTQQRSLNDYFQSANSELSDENEQIKKDLSLEREFSNNLIEKVNELNEEVNFYKNLLTKPMEEIAENNEDFKKTYQLQMSIMTNWMVSQKAFKEIAINLGKEKGMTVQEISELGIEKKLDVINDSNNPEHNTNFEDLPGNLNVYSFQDRTKKNIEFDINKLHNKRKLNQK